MKASLRWRGSIKVGSIGLRSKKVSSVNKYMKAVYLGFGNHLVIKADYFGQFEKETSNRHIEEAVELYQQWYGIVMNLCKTKH